MSGIVDTGNDGFAVITLVGRMSQTGRWQTDDGTGTATDRHRAERAGGERRVSGNPIRHWVFLPEDFW
jgi:hypothetical protein